MSRDVELMTGGVRCCGRCGVDGLLTARVPHAWSNRSGQAVEGWKELVLCQECDASDPAAAEVLALFAVDGSVTERNLETFAELTSAWAEAVAARGVDVDRLAAEESAWRRGEL